MNKEDKIKSLTWAYFFQQKVTEFFIMLALIFVPYSVGMLGKSIPFKPFQWFFQGDWKFLIWYEGLLLILGILVTVVGIVILLMKNWEKAEKKAKKFITQSKSKAKKK